MRVGVEIAAGLDRIVAAAGGARRSCRRRVRSASARGSASRGSLLAFLRAAIAALRRCIVGILRPVRRLDFGRGAGRRRQFELGGNHQRRALAILDARFSMLVPPMPRMMLSMIFSSKVWSSSSSSSAARTGPAAITRPTPRATAASRAPASASVGSAHPDRLLRSCASRSFLFRFLAGSPAPGAAAFRGSVSAGIRALLRRVPPGRNHTIGPPPRQRWPHRQG